MVDIRQVCTAVYDNLIPKELNTLKNIVFQLLQLIRPFLIEKKIVNSLIIHPHLPHFHFVEW